MKRDDEDIHDLPTPDEAALDDPELLAELALLAAPAPPSPGGLARLMHALDTAGPFEHLVGAVADLVAVGRPRARALLDRLADVSRWPAGPRPWIRLLHLEGVGVADAVVGFVRVEAGRPFPHHTHFGEEHVLILQGSCDDGRRVLRAGDVGRMPPDSAHALTAGPEAPLIYLAVVFEGLEVDGVALRP